MNEKISVLDHGYIQLIETWGSDERIIESARMSTAKGFLGWGPKEQCRHCGEPPTLELTIASGHRFANGEPECVASGLSHEMGPYGPPGDEKLLKYLYENKHSTPFEFAGMTIEVQAPIFVFREWHRHRTQSYNEMSARYTPLPDVNYVPSLARLLVVSSDQKNKQAGTVAGVPVLREDAALLYQDALKEQYRLAETLYQEALAHGVPKELARVHLPVGRYSKMRTSTDLRNWLGFLTLRMAPNAQWEIRQYANEVGKLIAEKFPRTWELFAVSK